MKKLIEFSIGNPVIVNLLVLLILISGLVSYVRLKRELFPDFSRRVVRVDTSYAGASPEEVEELITAKIEEQVRNVDGVNEMLSTSREGQSEIRLQMQSDTEMSRALGDVRAALDRVVGLPEEADEPRVSEVLSTIPVITVALSADIPEQELREIAKDVRDRLRRVDGVATVSIFGTRESRILIEIDPERLDQYRLSLDEIRAAVSNQNRNVPGGALKTARGEVLVRTLGVAGGVADVERMILRATGTGHALTVGDVARVRESFEDPTFLARYDGKPSINLVVVKERSGDTISVAERVRDSVTEIRRTLPETVSVGVFNDFSVFIRNRLSTLGESGAIGLAIVLTTLCLFVRGRIALLTSLGIPFAVMGCLVLMSVFGLSLNMISAFGLILVLGLLVDDAVIVTENVYRYVEQGLPPKEAALQGTYEVAWPVVTTVLTTVAAFVPFLLLPGTIGFFLKPLPFVVTFALLLSLLEVLFILPSHLSDVITPGYASKLRRGERLWLTRLRRRERLTGLRRLHVPGQRLWLTSLRHAYETVLAVAVRWRYVAVTVIVAASVLLAAAAQYRVPFVLFREFESSQFFVNFETSANAKLEDTGAVAVQAEDIVLGLPPGELKSLATTVGIAFLDVNRVIRGSNVGQLTLELRDDRRRTTAEVIDDLRGKMERIPGITKLQFLGLQAGPGGPDIEARVIGEDLESLRRLTEEVKGFLATLPGVRDIRDDLVAGKEELRISLKPEGRTLGLDVRSIARQVQQGFQGVEASSIQRGDEDVPIVIRFPRDRRSHVDTVSRMKLALPSGERVFLRDVADIRTGISPSQINRDDRKRTLSVFAEVETGKTTVVEATNALKRQFADAGRRYPGQRVVVKGERQEMEESLAALPQISLITLFVIYFVLGSLFKSFIQPFIVMAAIPFALGGVVIGHLVMGENLSFMSLLGFIALAGVVVNDSLILVDFINRSRRNGASAFDSIIQSGVVRLRPVLLTTVTTVGGLVPLAFFATGQAKFLSPMAISVVWGLSFATVLTLILTPCLYAMLDDAKGIVRKLFRSGAPAPDGVAAPEEAGI